MSADYLPKPELRDGDLTLETLGERCLALSSGVCRRAGLVKGLGRCDAADGDAETFPGLERLHS